MREPRCTSVVSAKNLWEIAIDFMEKIDKKLMSVNLKYAYITYRFCKLKKFPKRLTSKLIFLCCFNDVGKLYSGENSTDTTIETYLFLKYFSPLKNYADITIVDEKKKSPFRYYYRILKMCHNFTTAVLELNDVDLAIKKISVDNVNYPPYDLFLLGKIVHKTDLFYEWNSMHYKTDIYKYISKTIFNGKEKNKFFSMLSSLFEMYSVQTLYHSKMTAIISYMIAKHMSVPSKRCKQIYVAGLCHDLGKVCVPLRILEKPDKLTDREYTIMKRHVEFTKIILRNKMDYEIIEMAYRHHEKIDGSGYPNKLNGIDLTLDQKILQVADVVSALIAKRSYKEAWTIEKTISILDLMVETNKLDKEVIECFKKNQKKIIGKSNILMAQADKIYSTINEERKVLYEQKEAKRAVEEKVVEEAPEIVIEKEPQVTVDFKDEANTVIPQAEEKPIEVKAEEPKPQVEEKPVEIKVEESKPEVEEKPVEIKADEPKQVVEEKPVEVKVEESKPVFEDEPIEKKEKPIEKKTEEASKETKKKETKSTSKDTKGKSKESTPKKAEGKNTKNTTKNPTKKEVTKPTEKKTKEPQKSTAKKTTKAEKK